MGVRAACGRRSRLASRIVRVGRLRRRLCISSRFPRTARSDLLTSLPVAAVAIRLVSAAAAPPSPAVLVALLRAGRHARETPPAAAVRRRLSPSCPPAVVLACGACRPASLLRAATRPPAALEPWARADLPFRRGSARRRAPAASLPAKRRPTQALQHPGHPDGGRASTRRRASCAFKQRPWSSGASCATSAALSRPRLTGAHPSHEGRHQAEQGRAPPATALVAGRPTTRRSVRFPAQPQPSALAPPVPARPARAPAAPTHGRFDIRVRVGFDRTVPVRQAAERTQPMSVACTAPALAAGRAP